MMINMIIMSNNEDDKTLSFCKFSVWRKEEMKTESRPDILQMMIK